MKAIAIASQSWLALFLIIVFITVGIATLEAISPPKNSKFCLTDSDCVTGGCSGQVCGQKNKAQEIITTCEYLPEYECQKKTGCGCVSGKCEWKKTREYLECMKNFEK